MRWRIPLVVALVLFVAVSCDQQPVEPPADQMADQTAEVPAFKVEHGAFTFDVDLEGEAGYPDCLGEPMRNHGTVKGYIRERITPSGNVIMSGWVDYHAYGEVTLEGLTSGDIYTLRNAHNPWAEMFKENGFYLLAFHWNEVYRTLDGNKLNLHLKGHIKVEPDGTVKIDRESYRCN